jgi:hypothetical protein
MVKQGRIVPVKRRANERALAADRLPRPGRCGAAARVKKADVDPGGRRDNTDRFERRAVSQANAYLWR